MTPVTLLGVILMTLTLLTSTVMTFDPSEEQGDIALGKYSVPFFVLTAVKINLLEIHVYYLGIPICWRILDDRLKEKLLKP